MEEPGGDLPNAEQQLHVTEEQRDRAVGELKEIKMAGQEANPRLSAALTAQPERPTELDSVKIALSNANRELEVKEKSIVSLKSEAKRAKELEARLVAKDALLNKLRDEINNLKKKNKLCTSTRDIAEELERRKESEMKLLDSLVTQTKQLEETKISLEEAKLVISSLSEKMEKGSLGGGEAQVLPADNTNEDEVECLRSELQLTKEKLVCAQEREKIASLKVESLLEELNSVKTELKLVTEVEEYGKKAMDDLAFALKEVATEANEVKEQLKSSKKEAEKYKSEAAQARFLLKSMENRCRTLLEEARKEAEKHKNTAERLRLEAEESQLAWHEKETMFVECIKKAEEDNVILQRENNRLLDALTNAKNKINTSKEENKKLRDILKQALNEANIAKEAAAIARLDNSQLKDSVMEKESALEILSQEIENLRANEALAQDNIKELKKLLRDTEASAQNGQRATEGWKSNAKLGRNYSLNTKEKPPMHNERDVKNEDAASPPVSLQRKKSLSLSFAEDASLSAEEFQREENGNTEQESEVDKNAKRRKPLLKRFGTMLSRRSFQRREPTVE